MAKHGNISILRDAANLLFTYRKRDPSSATGDYFSSASITAANIKVINTSDGSTILASTAMTYVAALRGYRYSWAVGSALDAIPVITVEVIPTRAVGVSATLTPIDSDEFEVTDILKRIDEVESDTDTILTRLGTNADASTDPSAASGTVFSKVRGIGVDHDALQSDFDAFESTNQAEHDATQAAVANVDTDLAALQTDFNSFETVNQGEHDATQSAIAQIGATARAQLIGPTTFQIPDSGSTTFVLEFVLKDTDASPTILDDPDSNIVDISAINQSGSSPTGVTLAGSPAGRMTRDSQGRYSLTVTVASTAIDGTQLRFTASFTEDSGPDVAIWTTMLGDFDQLDDIQSQVNAIRSTDVPAIQANIDSEHVTTRTLISSEHATTRTLVSTETAAIDADLASIKGTGFSSATDSLKALQDEHDATQATVAAIQATVDHATFGLAALKAILDAEAASIASLHSKIGTNADAAGTTTVFARLRQAVESYLADPTAGLSALNTDLDNLLARLGLTADTGGTTTAGTAMAKLNAILVDATAILDNIAGSDSLNVIATGPEP